MTLSIAAVVVGLIFLVWSADRFIEGAVVTAKYYGMSPLLIGMVIVGFGTSAPEMVVSALASIQGNPGIALGNAYGSNIANIALVLGITALLSPIAVESKVLRKELPILIAVTVLAAFQLADGYLSIWDAMVLMLVFFVLMGWSIYWGIQGKGDALGDEMQDEVESYDMPLKKAIFWLILGLVILVLSSRLLVWAAVDIAVALGVSDLIIGLTVIAIGTSLPELASSLMAVKKGEHDIALGNVIGSNLFNTLMVVGIAGLISPTNVDAEILTRDIVVMAGLTVLLFIFAYGFRRPGRINRIEGGVLLTIFVGYTSYLISTVIL